MRDQNIRSFESRTRSSTTKKTPAAKKTTSAGALSRTSSSSAVITFGDVAPSDIEIYNQVGLLYGTKGEKAPELKARSSENELRVATHIIQILRRVEELENKVAAQHREVLLRVQDILEQPSTIPTAAPPSSLASEVEFIKSMTFEGRTAIAGLTQAVNKLVDIPVDIAALSRTVRGISTGQHTTIAPPTAVTSGSVPPAHVNASVTAGPPAPRAQHHSNGPSNGKRDHDRAFASSNDATPSKRSKADSNFSDVYLWDVDPGKGTPAAIAHTAMARCGFTEREPFVSVRHPRNAPKTVISMRFKSTTLADAFIDKMRSDPPASMSRLHAARPDVYEKRADHSMVLEHDPW